MLELFSELYGCYYTTIEKILYEAYDGLSSQEIETIINEHAFSDSAFYIMPRLLSGEWDLLEQDEAQLWHSKLYNKTISRPLSFLEKSWIKALLLDKRTKLFLSDEEIDQLNHDLSDIEPLFLPEDVFTFDQALDGDEYEDETYRQIFHQVLSSILKKKTLHVQYTNHKSIKLTMDVIPYKLNYSSRDDKFRLLALKQRNEYQYDKLILNLARIQAAKPSTSPLLIPDDIDAMFEQSERQASVIIQIFPERNALERCMLQFSSWYKKTEYNEEQDCYICEIFYDYIEETELLIRLLSFGPTIKVLSPERFVAQIKERIQKQYDLNHI